MRNLYDVLGVDPGADVEQLKGSIQNLAKIFHPDPNLGDAVAERRFREICQAYGTMKVSRREQLTTSGLAHQRKKAWPHVSTAVMAGFTTSMLSTIIISLVMVWLLTDSRQASATGQNGYAQSKEAASAPQAGTLPRR